MIDDLSSQEKPPLINRYVYNNDQLFTWNMTIQSEIPSWIIEVEETTFGASKCCSGHFDHSL